MSALECRGELAAVIAGGIARRHPLHSTLHLRLHRLAAAPDHCGPPVSLSRPLADLAA